MGRLLGRSARLRYQVDASAVGLTEKTRVFPAQLLQPSGNMFLLVCDSLPVGVGLPLACF